MSVDPDRGDRRGPVLKRGGMSVAPGVQRPTTAPPKPPDAGLRAENERLRGGDSMPVMRHWLCTTPEGTPLDSARTSFVTDERNVALCRETGWKVEGPFVLEHAGAVDLTDAERERMLWWLHKPVPPGPMKDLDVAIIRKLTTTRGQ